MAKTSPRLRLIGCVLLVPILKTVELEDSEFVFD